MIWNCPLIEFCSYLFVLLYLAGGDDDPLTGVFQFVFAGCIFLTYFCDGLMCLLAPMYNYWGWLFFFLFYFLGFFYGIILHVVAFFGENCESVLKL